MSNRKQNSFLDLYRARLEKKLEMVLKDFPQSMFWSLIGKAAAIYILAKALSCVWIFVKSYVLPYLGGGIDFKSYGEWAVVTGATDGIGKSYAKELAKKGMNLVLISRNQEKLDSVAAEIEKSHKVKVKTIAFDYGVVSGYDAIKNELKDMEIGVLVNNVGVSYEYPEYFASVSVERFQDMLNINILSTVQMTHMVLKGMVERKKGILIHISSSSAFAPFPLLTVYSASKAFMDYFARSLQIEYKDKGIISQSVLPLLVSTKLSKMRVNLFAPSPDAYVRQSLNTVGSADRTTGYWAHAIQHFFMSLLPGPIFNSQIFSHFKGIRQRALRRKAKSQ